MLRLWPCHHCGASHPPDDNPCHDWIKEHHGEVQNAAMRLRELLILCLEGWRDYYGKHARVVDVPAILVKV